MEACDTTLAIMLPAEDLTDVGYILFSALVVAVLFLMYTIS